MKKVFIAFLTIVILSVGIWLFVTKVFFYQNQQPVKISAYYMRYACGECYPQWNVDSAENSLKNIVGKDVMVLFKGKPIEDYLSEKENEELITYHFSFEGRLKSTISKNYIFEAQKYSYVINYKQF